MRVEQVGAADQLVELADAQLRHDLARLFGDEEEVVDHVLGPALELLAQHRVLRGHADRAGVEVALAHHDAALDDQRRGREAELVGAQQRADHDVAAGLHLAVGLHADAAAQAVQHQRLLRLGQAQLPRRAGVLDASTTARRRCRRRGRRSRRGRPWPWRRRRRSCRRRLRCTSLTLMLGARVGVLQVVDQLRQVFDRIDVVVRRRRDEADARHRVAQQADVLAHLAAGQLAALAGLGALRHLDLDLVGRDQVLGRHAEAARGDLLDLRAQRVAVLQLVVGLDAPWRRSRRSPWCPA